MKNIININNYDRSVPYSEIVSNFIFPANVTHCYPLKINRYYYNLIKAEGDPIYKQSIPDAAELHFDNPARKEKINHLQHPVKNMIHRYPDRVVILVTNQCPTHCRFCFRKQQWKNNKEKNAVSITDENIMMIKSYLHNHQEICEILISGGDPFMLKTKRLKYILDVLFRISSIKTIRIGTRIPVTMPMRIDKKLIQMLKQYESLWIATHFNHPSELTAESIKACRSLITNGIPIVNQTVLLKGVNDHADTLTQLFRDLVKAKIKPMYLFHIDPVEGVDHFATGLKAAVNLIREIQPNLSSLATPVLAIDLPNGKGKVRIEPQRIIDGKFEDIDGETTNYPFNDL